MPIATATKNCRSSSHPVYEQPQGFPEKILRLWIVPGAEAGQAEVVISHHLERVVFMCPLADGHGPACVARLRIESRVPIRKVTLGVPSFNREEGRDLLALDDASTG